MSTKYTGNQIKHLGKAGIRSALKNRALRSKLPDSYLPPKLLARRQSNQKAATAKAKASAASHREVVPGSGLTQGAYNHQVDAATKLKYGPQERELGRQLGVNAQQQTRDAGWYDQYRQQIQQAEQQQAANNADLSRQLDTFSMASMDASTALNKSQFAGMDADAANRGATRDPVLNSIAGNAGLIREALTNSFGSQAALQNAAGVQYLNNSQSGAGLAKLEHLGALSSAGNQILKDQQGLAADKGAYKVQYGQDLKDQAHKTVLENQTFGLNTAKAQATIRHQRNTEKVARTNSRTSRQNASLARKKAAASSDLAERKFSSAQAKDAYQRSHHLGPYKPAAKKDTKTNGKGDQVTPAGVKVRTPAQHDKISGSIDSTGSVVRGLKAKYHNNRHRIAGAILSDPKNKGELATSIALDIAFDGHVSAHNRSLLWKKGYSLSELGLPGPTKKKKKTGAQAYNKGNRPG